MLRLVASTLVVPLVSFAAWPGSAEIESACEKAARLSCEASAKRKDCAVLHRELAEAEKILAATPKPPPKPPFRPEPRPGFTVEDEALYPEAVASAHRAWVLRQVARRAALRTQADRDYAAAESNAASARWKADHYCAKPFDTGTCISLKIRVCPEESDVAARRAPR